VGPIRDNAEEDAEPEEAAETNRPIIRRQPVARAQMEVCTSTQCEPENIEMDKDDVSDDDDDESIDLLKRHVADLNDYIRCKRRARRLSREINRRNYTEILVRFVRLFYNSQ